MGVYDVEFDVAALKTDANHEKLPLYQILAKKAGWYIFIVIKSISHLIPVCQLWLLPFPIRM